MADGVKQVGYDTRQFNNTAPVLVSLSTSTARSTVLSRGLYVMTCDVDCTFLQGASTVNALTTSRSLWARSYRWVYVHGDEDGYVAAILASGTGTLSLEKVSSNDGL